MENCRKSSSPADYTPHPTPPTDSHQKCDIFEESLTENTLKLNFLSQNIHETTSYTCDMHNYHFHWIRAWRRQIIYCKQLSWPSSRDKNPKCCKSFISYELTHILGLYIRFIPPTVQKQNWCYVTNFAVSPRQSIWQAVGNYSTHSVHIQDSRKTFVSKTPQKFDFSTVSNSVMLTDYIQVDIENDGV